MSNEEPLALFDGLSEWGTLVAEAVSLLPNEEHELFSMDVDDLERLFRLLYVLVTAIEGVAAERVPAIREAIERAQAAIRMYELAESQERRTFDLAKAA